VCSAEWAPDTSEQQNDLAAHCENRSGTRYLRFQRNETTGSVVCLFSASPESGRDGLGAAEVSGKADSLISVELPELVRKWTELCLEKERNRDRETANCWLDAANAIDGHAADVGAPLANQINELQAAWLHRARDLLTLQAKEKTAIQSVSLTADDSTPPDPFAAEDVPASPSVTTVPVLEQPAPAEVEKPILRETPAKLRDGEPSPQKKGHEAARKKIISAAGEIPSGKVAMRAEIPKRLTDAKTQGKKAVQRRIAKKQVALAVTEDKEASARPSKSRKRLIKLPFLSKTATSSKCFVAVEWC
jgi:hypothetical protein